MRIDLVYPDVSSFHGLPYHPGLASIAAVLKASGHDVSVHYFDTVVAMDRVLADVTQRKPDIVGFTAVETQFPYVRELAGRIKKTHRCTAVCGGVYATLFPEILTEADSPLDAVVMGEGEHSLLAFITTLEKGLSWSEVPNLAYRGRDSQKLIKNRLAPLISDLDLLPFPAVELFSYQGIIDRHNVALFHFNRGCPYHCTFCSNEALGKVYGLPSNKMRYRTVASVIDEIVSTLAKYRITDDTLLCFQDDLFISNKRWIMEFCSVYQQKIGRPFWCTGRSNQISDEICAALKKAGCRTLMMSVESGNDYIRNDVMKRGISRDVLVGSFEACHRHGINTMVSCIIGLPFETPAMIEDSIKTMASLRSIATYGINIFYPYRGTVLRSVCEENGFIPADLSGSYGFEERKESVLDLPALSKAQIRYYHDNWIRLIMKNKGTRDRFKYWVWTKLDAVRTSRFGKRATSAINGSRVGRRLKQYINDLMWSRY